MGGRNAEFRHWHFYTVSLLTSDTPFVPRYQSPAKPVHRCDPLFQWKTGGVSRKPRKAHAISSNITHVQDDKRSCDVLACGVGSAFVLAAVCATACSSGLVLQRPREQAPRPYCTLHPDSGRPPEHSLYVKPKPYIAGGHYR